MESLLKPETLIEIERLLTQYPQRRSAALPILHLVQDDMGYISQEATEWIAKQLMIEPIAVYELITFYPMFRQAPIGRKHVKVCRTLSCALAGSYHVCDRLQKALNCPLGGTSPDGEYTVEFVECLASCGTAPVVMVDEKLHENVKPENIDQWVSDAFPNHSKK